MLGLLIPVPLDPVVQAFGRDPQTTRYLRDLVTAIRHLPDRLDLGLLAIPLPTHDHLRYSYIVTLEGVYETRGDSLHGELLPTIRLMAENGIPECQWRLYSEYGQKKEDAIWLCRSADNGYAKAQLHVGRLYWSASNIQNNRTKAYVWYKLAATGDMLQGLLPDANTQTRAETAMQDAEKFLTPEQIAETTILYTEWHQGQCVLELIPEIIDS